MEYPREGTYGRAIIDRIAKEPGRTWTVAELTEEVGCSPARVASFGRMIEALPAGAKWFGYDLRVERKPPGGRIEITLVEEAS